MSLYSISRTEMVWMAIGQDGYTGNLYLVGQRWSGWLYMEHRVEVVWMAIQGT